jgi:hypothetical protein
MSLRARTALAAALILALHSVVLCAGGDSDCSPFRVSSGRHQEQGCHEHERHPAGLPHCLCCESVLCASRMAFTRTDGSSTSDRIAAFAPVRIATLPLNPAHIDGTLLRVSESPPLSPVSLFLTHRKLLL